MIMGPAFYVLAILGCGEADSACEQVAVAPAQYQSLDECNRATDDAVTQHQDALYPVVVAQCRRADAQSAEKLMPEQIDLPEPSRTPAVRRASFEQVRPKTI
jgi:hypothetical protein